MRRSIFGIHWTLWMAASLLSAGILLFSCSNDDSTAGGSRALQISDRAALIGGPMAAGDQGDFLLENSQIRAVVSKAGISRAFGLFGGTIVDADRVRSGMGRGSSPGGQGFDSLVEMFPLFFLGAVDPEESKVINDGKNGEPAVIRVSGKGASFVALTEQINNLVTFALGQNRLHFDMDYILRPGVNYIELKVKVTNKSDATYVFNDFSNSNNPDGTIPSATGIVGLFGKRNSVFIPGIAGYNIRFSLENVYKKTLKPPALPGLVGDFIASRGQNGVNYGIVAKPEDSNYVYKFKDEFKKLGVPFHKGSVLVPLEGSSITACFAKIVPTSLKPNASFESTLYVVVGDGSVSSIRNAQLEIHNLPKGMVTGQVFEAGTHHPMANARVLVYTGEGNQPGDRIFYSEFISDARGFFQGYLEADADGNKARKYKLMVLNGRIRSEPKEIEVKKDQRTAVIMELPQAGRVNVTVRDQKGRLIPAKIQVIGKVKDFQDGRCIGRDPLGCMYDLHVGESKIDSDFRVGLRCSDLKTTCMSHGDCKAMTGDKQCLYRLDGETEYREVVFHSTNGQANLAVRPGKYRIVASRGMEYEIAQTGVMEIKAGGLLQVNLQVVHSVPTPQAISADLHVHTNLSHDVSISDRDRIASYAAEGVDYFVTTDHNRIRDIQPLVLSYQLERWLKTGIGVELTTFEMGHFNAFPLIYDQNLFNGGNPDWFKKETRYDKPPAFPPDNPKTPLQGLREGIPPGELFSALRQRASLCNNKPDCDKVIIQINHPRDSIFGYFGVFGMGEDGLPTHKAGLSAPISREFDADQFSTAFNAIEVFNGNRFDLLWHWRVPPGVNSVAGYPAVPNSIMRIQDGSSAKLAYPGGASDWFTLLNRGMSLTGTGNSDSHDHEPEAGYPRNYLWVGYDEPSQMNDEGLVQVIQQKKVLMTNGPILEVWLRGDGDQKVAMGGTIKAKDKVFMSFRLRAASWVDVTKLLVYKNGRLAKEIKVPQSTDVERMDTSKEYELDVSDGDAWFVVVAQGAKDMWPVVRSEELTPFQIGEALGLIQGSLLGGLGLSLGENVCLMPTLIRTTVPYAITNPIWVATGSSGKYTPDPCRTLGPKGVRCSEKGSTCQDGYCLGTKDDACKQDTDCKIVAGQSLPRCINGKCTVDPCATIGCNKDFKTCTSTDVCPHDLCEESNRRCADGTPCTKDNQCTGKGDGLCRYCACPEARMACEDGRSCASDKDCGQGKCESRRFCAPTGCTMGYCMPTYPTCNPSDVVTNSHLFLRTSANSNNYTKLTIPLPTRKPMVPKDQQGASLGLDQRFHIRKVKPFFLFFEHKH